MATGSSPVPGVSICMYLPHNLFIRLWGRTVGRIRLNDSDIGIASIEQIKIFVYIGKGGGEMCKTRLVWRARCDRDREASFGGLYIRINPPSGIHTRRGRG